MRSVRGYPSDSSTSWPRGANLFYAVIILSFSAASINSSSPPPIRPASATVSPSPEDSTLSSSSPASSTHFNASQVSISEFTSTTQPLVRYNSPDDASSGPIFTNQFVLEIQGGEDSAKNFAEKHGFTYLGQIFENHYHLLHHRISKRSLTPHDDQVISKMVDDNSKVLSLKQQPLLSRKKRDFLTFAPSSSSISSNTVSSSQSVSITAPTSKRFNDNKWLQMWYLNRGNGLDMNVEAVWDKNITGRGVVVTILDDGLEKNHPDLIANYDPLASYDINSQDTDPMPRYDMLDSNRHGTRCAGEVAADANNTLCAVGVAYGAKVGGVRMLDGDVTDTVEAQSLGLNPQHIHIYSASWGPDDDGKTVDGPGEMATRAFIEGVNKGRNGLGSIFVWASGNGGREHDNCNCDGYTNSIWTLSISSATENGLVPWYSEACSSTFAATYSSGSYGEKQIVTTDLHHGCTLQHTGTSASAPLAAGICALALEANRNLTWRDMQHIVVLTARQGNLHARDWRVNGVGRNVSHSFGYGLMDALAMVEVAKDWVTVPTQTICQAESPPFEKLIPANSHVEMTLDVKCDKVKFLEHVQAKITLTATRRGDIHIYLTSPSGTRSTLLAQRPMDNSRSGFNAWPFMTVHMWNENPNGKWKLEVHNEGRFYSRAYLKEWSLILYGTEIHPDRRKRKWKSSRVEQPQSILSQQQQPQTNGQRQSQVQQTTRQRVHTGVRRPDLTDLSSNQVDATQIHPQSAGSPGPFTHHRSMQQHELLLTRAHKSEDESSRLGDAKASKGCISFSELECLGCTQGFKLWDGRCLTECPAGTYADESWCRKCHYSCHTCLTDNNCTSCFADSQLHNRSGRCYAKELVQEVIDLEKWYTAVTVVFLCLCLVIFLLVVYIVVEKNPSLVSTSSSRSKHHHHHGYHNDSHHHQLHRTSNGTSSAATPIMQLERPSTSIYRDEFHSEDDM